MTLSIITINYNNAAGLEKTIQSIVAQRPSSFKYLVIDGGSSDSSVDVINSYAHKIDYWTSEPDRGIYHAMNKGIQQATGEYILFINSGDTINADAHLHTIIDTLSTEDIIYYDIEIAIEARNKRLTKTYPEELDFKHFVEETLPHPATFIKRERLIEYGGYAEHFKIVADWAFFIDAVCIHKWAYRHVGQVFSTFSYGGGISSLPENQIVLWAERDEHIRTHYSLFNSFYLDYRDKKQELYKLKTAKSVQWLKKLGFLKWLKL